MYMIITYLVTLKIVNEIIYPCLEVTSKKCPVCMYFYWIIGQAVSRKRRSNPWTNTVYVNLVVPTGPIVHSNTTIAYRIYVEGSVCSILQWTDANLCLFCLLYLEIFCTSEAYRNFWVKQTKQALISVRSYLNLESICLGGFYLVMDHEYELFEIAKILVSTCMA